MCGSVLRRASHTHSFTSSLLPFPGLSLGQLPSALLRRRLIGRVSITRLKQNQSHSRSTPADALNSSRSFYCASTLTTALGVITGDQWQRVMGTTLKTHFSDTSVCSFTEESKTSSRPSQLLNTTVMHQDAQLQHQTLHHIRGLSLPK